MTNQDALIERAEANLIGVLKNAWLKAVHALNQNSDPIKAGALCRAELSARKAYKDAEKAEGPGVADRESTPITDPTYTATQAIAYLATTGKKVLKAKLYKDTAACVISRNEQGRYPKTALDAYATGLPLLTGAGGSSTAEMAEEKLRQEIRKLSAEADQKELQYQIECRDLIPVGEVVERWGQQIVACKAKLLSIPTKAAPLVLSAGTLAEARAILEIVINEALDELSGDTEEAIRRGSQDSENPYSHTMEAPPDSHREPMGRRRAPTKPRSKRGAGKVADGTG